ncbi:aminomethyltransferase family protein [Halobiforma nitratireducens]|uniref:Lipoprotein n=1 Tax=Halobiforma nitratireducens JCM 10879 TaxID=1227454 RepID=M0LXA1_9EURY|nr:hypothetical protein [Halobiforma nitratireducens]EMA38212.1 hypothetical protein C446_10195 [Halobiforma nitratireducens JCM 10879]
MERRPFLTALSGSAPLLAGCTALVDDDPANETDDDGTNTEPSTDDDLDRPDEFDPLSPESDPSVVDFETAPLSAAVVDGRLSTADRLSVVLDFVAPATAESPARLGAVLENRKPFAQTFRPRRLLVLDDPASGRDDDRNTIYLVPTADNELAETVPALERDADGRWRVESVRDDWYPKSITLGAEERVVLEFAVVGHHDRSEPPIDAGTYRFSWRDNGFSIAVWPTETPGPTDESRFAGADVPSIPDTKTEWYHDAGQRTETFLRADAETVDTPGRIEFELVNRARESMSGNPYRWRLYKLVDDAWIPVYPWEFPLPLAAVTPGESDETELVLYHGEPVGRQGRTVGHLGGGRYAYTVGYSLEDETHAAMFEVDAPTLSIGPEPDAEIDRDGDTVVVRLPNYEDARRPSTVTVTRTSSAEERLIEEQLPRRPFRAFRNTLSLFEEGVEEVRLETDRSTALRSLDFDEGETRTIEYDGDAFEATGRVLEEP